MESRVKKMFVALAFAGVLAVGSVIPAFATVEYVGGGTWNHGLYDSPRGVWSNYVHNEMTHSATSICDSTNNKVIKDKWYWANTDAYGSGTRYAYWNIY